MAGGRESQVMVAREQGGGPAVRWGGVNPEGRKMKLRKIASVNRFEAREELEVVN